MAESPEVCVWADEKERHAIVEIESGNSQKEDSPQRTQRGTEKKGRNARDGLILAPSLNA
jgi:hypothetical protein